MLMCDLRILLIGLLLLVPSSSSALQDPPASDSPAVAELVKQLGSTQRDVRESAEQELIDRGPNVLNQLPEYDAVESTAVRSALFRIRRELEEIRIEQSLLSTLVEFPDRDLSLAEAVELIRKQTGNDLRISKSLPAPADSVRFPQKEFTFWEAVIHLIEKYQLDVEVGESGRGLVLVEKATKRAYFSSTDINFRFPGRPAAWRLNKVERKQVFGRNDEELLRFEMQLLWEPRQTPMFVRISGDQLAYQEEAGSTDRKQLRSFSPEAVTEIPCHQLPISPAFRVDWIVPTDQKLSAVSFHPSADVTLAVGRFDFEFRDWQKSRTSQRRGMGVVVRDELLITDEEVSFVLILLFSERGAPFESHREWLSQNLIELKSADQVLKPFVPPEKELEADGSVAFRYRFKRPAGMPGDWTLHYRFPTSFREIGWGTSAEIDLSDWLQPSEKKNDPQ